MKKQPKKNEDERGEDKPDLQVRAATIEVRAGEADKPASVRMSISSETPVRTVARIDGEWRDCYEILDHSAGSIDMSRCKDGLVVLDRHFGDQVGLMACEVAGRKLAGEVRFCNGPRAQDISKDAAQGLRRNVSVGYLVDSSSYRTEGAKDGIPVVRAMSWTPYEASFEPVPADTTVGVNRAAQTTTTATTVESEERNMDPKVIQAMYQLAMRHGIGADAVAKLIEDGKGMDALSALVIEKQAEDNKAARSEIEVLKTRKPDAPAVKTIAPIGGSPEAEQKVLRRYNVMNVLRRMAGVKADDGFEREISDECGKLRNKPAEGIIIPHAVLSRRDLTVSGTSSASVATMLEGGQFIDLLRTEYALGQLGVQFLTGLVGDIAIPKMTAGATGYWVSEGTAVTESTPTLGQVTGSPHTAGALVEISRKLLIQSTPDAESMVRNEIIQRVLRTVQIAVFAGTGADGQPSAITTASGINNPSVTQGTPTFAEILGFPSAIMADNARADGQKWAMTGEVWAKLAATATNGNGSPLALDYASKTLIGFPYVMTEDLPANSLWFGNWASVVLGIWGNGVDVATTDSQLFTSGGLTLRALQDVDVMVRLGQALAYNTAVTS